MEHNTAETNVVNFRERKYTAASFDGFRFWLDYRNYSESSSDNYCRIIANVCNELGIDPDALNETISNDYADKQLKHKASVVRLYLTFHRTKTHSARNIYVGAINEKIISSFQRWYETQPQSCDINVFCDALKEICANHELNLRAVGVSPDLLPELPDAERVMELFNAFRADALQYADLSAERC